MSPTNNFRSGNIVRGTNTPWKWAPPPPPPPPPPLPPWPPYSPPPPPPPNNVEPFYATNFETGRRENSGSFSWAVGSENVTVSTERPYSGSYSLRFSFTGKADCQDSSAEQRFNMGRYLSELWLEYQLYVPSNYKHRSQSSLSCEDTSTNNKFQLFWRDWYDGRDGAWRCGREYQRQNDTGSTSRFYSTNSTKNVSYDQPFAKPLLISPTGPIVIGQWNKIQLHLKAASARFANNGVMEFWVNGTLVDSKYNADFANSNLTAGNSGVPVTNPLPDPAALRNGYFMGAANSGFTETTVFFIDDVKFYNTDPGWY